MINYNTLRILNLLRMSYITIIHLFSKKKSPLLFEPWLQVGVYRYFPQQIFKLTGNTGLPWVIFLHVSYQHQSYSVLYPEWWRHDSSVNLRKSRMTIKLLTVVLWHHNVNNGSTVTLCLFWLKFFIFTYCKTNS